LSGSTVGTHTHPIVSLVACASDCEGDGAIKTDVDTQVERGAIKSETRLRAWYTTYHLGMKAGDLEHARHENVAHVLNPGLR
jgi:hypothetical protein